MDEDQITAKKKYAGEKKTSMKRRDDHHDYKERRMYMITMEVEGRRPLFGRLVGNPFAERGSKDEPHIELTPLGKAVQGEWMRIHDYYPQIEVMAVQMMPDHMHGILFVRESLPVHLGQVISGFKAGCRKAQRAMGAAAQPLPTGKETHGHEDGARPFQQVTASPSQAVPTPSQAVPTPSQAIPTPSQAIPMPSQAIPTPSQGVPIPSQGVPIPSQGVQPYYPLFAKGYNDLILRSFDELPVWKNYLRDNPRRLMIKRERPEWLRPFFGLHIGSHVFNGIGNRTLLTAAKKIAVRVSRRFTDAQIVAETERYLALAKNGTVLVSPSISPGEKKVMRTAFDAGFPTIVIMENGFTPLSKPHGEQFYACAKGHLLMLSPWEHHNERKKLTAEQCSQMNLMALEICELSSCVERAYTKSDNSV